MSRTGLTRQLKKNFRISALILVILAGLITILGKGGGGAPATPPAPPGDTTAPTVSSSTPNDSSTGVARDTTVTATFSEAIDAATIDTSSFSLRDGQGAMIPAAVVLDTNTNIATLTPNQALNLLTGYTATLSTDITDVAGNALAAAVNWSFTSADGQWGMADPIENSDGAASEPQIAIDASGNALAVWTQVSGGMIGLPFIEANRYTAGSGWGMPFPGISGVAFEPQIAIDANGDGIAVWTQDTGTNGTFIFSARYTAASGQWSMFEQIGTDVMAPIANGEGKPQIAIDAGGNAMVVWEKDDGAGFNFVYANRYDATSGQWGTPERVDLFPAGTAQALSPQVAVDADGNALAIWSTVVVPQLIFANRYDAASGLWGAAVIVQTDTMAATAASNPQITMDANGNALAVWEQGSNPPNSIYANRYDAASDQWGTEAPIETEIGHAVSPQIAIDASGDALAVWAQGGAFTNDVWWNRYTAASGQWGMADKIGANADTDIASSPQVAIDANGNALAVWSLFDGVPLVDVENIWSSRYTAAMGWSAPAKIETDDVGDALNPQIAIDPNGNALAVWEQDDGTRSNIVTNRLE